jgi:predicted nucleic acid-binding protein
MDTFVIDACAFIAYLRKENGHQKVKDILTGAKNLNNTVLMHAATLAEVYYDFWRAKDRNTATEVLADSKLLPIQFIDAISTDMIQHIGYFKTRYKTSFADTFVLATAKLNNAKVVTSDHHEFDAVEKNDDVQFEWIR